MKVLRERLKKFKGRLRHYRKLRRSGVDTARLFRTGGKAAMTYGEGIMGVSNSLLRDQRRAAAAATSPASGPGGQNIDTALLIADGGPRGRADPAYDAHDMPIGQWSMAVWEQWVPVRSLLTLAASAKLRLTNASRIWAKVYGPAAAMVASCARLDWVVIDGLNLVTDEGKPLNLSIDPPAVVREECREAVRRWRWRNIAMAMPQLSLGAVMQPVWKLLSSNQNDEQWNPRLRGYLKSVISDRQWPQVRLKAAGKAEHDRCVFCLQARIEQVRQAKRDGDQSYQWFNDLVQTAGEQPHPTESARLHATRTAAEMMVTSPQTEMIIGVPVGTLMHRNWVCPTLQQPRQQHNSRGTILQATAGDRWHGHPQFIRGLTPMISKPKLPRSATETFHWGVRPSDDLLMGTVYTDGSMLDGPDQLTARCGWSFAVLDDDFNVIASARGVCPSWVYDIHGAEVWAVLQAASLAMPGATVYMIDCLSVVQSLQEGRARAVRSDKMHARVYNLLCTTLDDVAGSDFVWLPAHKSEEQVGSTLKGDATPLTLKDLKGNAEADRLAKLAVSEHRVSRAYVKQWDDLKHQAESTARWAARAAELANSALEFPHRDSTASRAKANSEAMARRGKMAAKKPQAQLRPLQLGGHSLVCTGEGAIRKWHCRQCKTVSATWAKIAGQKCSGSASERWAKQAMVWADAGATYGGGHTRVLSGDVTWCSTCGAYADARAIGLAKPCPGPPKRGGHYGGAWGKLRKLLRGVHPRTSLPMPAGVDERGRPIG
jgi:hypothetical protein